MPLPKPSKMISKRFKKPQTLNPSIKPPPPPSTPFPEEKPFFSHHKLFWPHQRKWRVRVICTDPDATDDSSADELDSPAASSSPRKCSIREIFLPVFPSSLSQPSTPESPVRPRRRRQSPNSHSIAQSKKLCCENCDSDAILQDMNALFDDASERCIGNTYPGLMHNRSLILSDSECVPSEEEFTRFLTEFVMDIGEKSAWDDGIDGSAVPSSPPLHEDEIADMLNLELDSEALTWINSLQRLP